MEHPAEPCRSCGRPTGAGTSLFVGRVRIGVASAFEFLCATCLEEHPLLDDDGVALSKERLAALSNVVMKDNSV